MTLSIATHGHHGGNCNSNKNPDLAGLRCVACGGRCKLCHFHSIEPEHDADGNVVKDGQPIARGKCPVCPPCGGCAAGR